MAGPANAERFVNYITGDPIALADTNASNFGPGYPGLVPPPSSPIDPTQVLTQAGWGPVPTAVLRGYIAGLNTSNNSGTPNTKIDIAAGQATDSTNAVIMTSSAVLTIDCTTVGANGLDAGALANNTWYHTFLIAKTDGTVASLASTSVAAPTLPSGYTYFRRIASFKTDGSAHIITYTQFGEDFLWKTPFFDYNATPGVTTAISVTLNVPLGVQTEAYITGLVLLAGGAGFLYLSSLDTTDVAAAATAMTVLTPSAGTFGSLQLYVRSNTSSQIRLRVDNVATLVELDTLGWLDSRGKNS